MVATNSTGLQSNDFTTVGNWTFDGTNFDVLASAIGQVDALNLNIGISEAVTMILGNISTVMTARASQMTLDSAALTFPSVPSVSPVGLFNIVVDGSGNLSFSNVANTGSGSAWDIGGNAGLADPSIFGTTSAAGINFQTNSVTFLSVTSAQDVLLSTTAGAGTLTVDAGGDLVVKASGTGATAIFGDLGNFLGLYGNNIDSFAQGGSASFNASVTLTLGGSVTPGVVIGSSATVIAIGSPAATTTIDSTLLKLANLPAATGGQRPVMADPVTGQLYLSP